MKWKTITSGGINSKIVKINQDIDADWPSLKHTLDELSKPWKGNACLEHKPKLFKGWIALSTVSIRWIAQYVLWTLIHWILSALWTTAPRLFKVSGISSHLLRRAWHIYFSSSKLNNLIQFACLFYKTTKRTKHQT